MSKIICDVCGTSYPDTADQCPICGCAKPEEAGEVKSYTHVKGGRFSAKNVNKRLKEKQVAYAYNPGAVEEEEEEEPVRSNRGLLIAVVLLLLAIISIAAYLYINYWMDPMKPDPDKLPGSTTTAPAATGETEQPSQTDPTQEDPAEVACQEIALDTNEVTLSNAGDGYLINYTLSPADTTDSVSFASDAPEVATVDENGKITAVAPGTAVITVTCGDVSSEIMVVCNIVTEPPTEPTTTPTTEPVQEFSLNRTDITMKIGEGAWPLYRGDIPKNSIEWWSGDESVATVNNGNVSPVGEGITTIYAKYNGKTYECIVRVKAE